MLIVEWRPDYKMLRLFVALIRGAATSAVISAFAAMLERVSVATALVPDHQMTWPHPMV